MVIVALPPCFIAPLEYIFNLVDITIMVFCYFKTTLF